MTRKTKSRRQMLAAAGVGLVAVAAGGTWAWRRSAAASDATDGLYQASFPAPAGQPITMAPMRGKPLVVNFWATWCAPCIKELPQFDRFEKEFAQKGWQVVGLAIDSAPAVNEFLKHTPVSFPIGLAGMDGSELMLALGNGHGVLPFTVVLDAAGDVQHKQIGETSYEQLVQWAGKA